MSPEWSASARPAIAGNCPICSNGPSVSTLMTNDSVHLTNDLRRESSVLSVHRKKPKLVHVTTPSSSKFLNYLERLKSAKIYFSCSSFMGNLLSKLRLFPAV